MAGAQRTRSLQDAWVLIERVMQIEACLVERGRANATQISQRSLGGLHGSVDRPEEAAVGAFDPALALSGQAQAAMRDLPPWGGLPGVHFSHRSALSAPQPKVVG